MTADELSHRTKAGKKNLSHFECADEYEQWVSETNISTSPKEISKLVVYCKWTLAKKKGLGIWIALPANTLKGKSMSLKLLSCLIATMLYCKYQYVLIDLAIKVDIQGSS